MNQVFYHPWMGGEYRASLPFRRALWMGRPTTGLRDGRSLGLHIMGESHYGDPHEHEPGETVRIISECAFAPNRKKNSQFFARVAHVILDAIGEERGIDYRRDLWSRVAFSNFIQELLPVNRTPPSYKQWEAGRVAFIDQLRITTPAVLLTLGWRVWKNLPKESYVSLGNIPPTSISAEAIPEARAYVYCAGNGVYSTLVVPVAHPSSGGHFNATAAAGRLRTALLSACHASGEEAVQGRMKALLTSPA